MPEFGDKNTSCQNYISVWLLKLPVRRVSGITHSKTDTHNTAHVPRHLTHIVEVCSIFAIEFIKGQLVIVLQRHREKKVASVQCWSVCMSVSTVCMCVCVRQKPETFTAHCVLTFHFKMTTSQEVERQQWQRKHSQVTGRRLNGCGGLNGGEESPERGGGGEGRKKGKVRTKRK